MSTKYWVSIEDWNTAPRKRIRSPYTGMTYLGSDPDAFYAKSGYVNVPDETKPLETDFANLTPQQRAIMKRENTYWVVVEARERTLERMLERRQRDGT